MERRTWLKWAAAAPVYAVMAARGVTAAVAAATGENSSGDVYRRLGVRPFINARGTWTYLSGSLELPEVRRAMDDAARHFVDIFELQQAAGRKLAQLSGAESGMVTSGAAGAMAAATAGCMAGTDPEQGVATTRHHRHEERSRHAGRTQRLRQCDPVGRREARGRRQCRRSPWCSQRSHRDGLHHVARRTAATGTGRDEEGRRSVDARRRRGHSANREPDGPTPGWASTCSAFPVARGCAGPSVREFCLEGRI